MSATRTLDALDRLIADLDPEVVAASRAEAIRSHTYRPTAPTTCDPQSFDAHVAGTDEFDGTPIFGTCHPGCAYA